jgi:Kazal-type serine protease inhibitor domain
MQRGKRWPFAVLMAAGMLLGCSRQKTMENLTMCTDPRPQACTREYVPVCGSAKGGAAKTYGNGCEACADVAVSGWAPGECP